MSGKKHAGTCGGCAACRPAGKAEARKKAQGAVAAETARRLGQRHVLDLGDRAVEVVQDKPGTWRLVTDGQRGPVLSPDDLDILLARHYRNTGGPAATAGVLGVSLSGGDYGLVTGTPEAAAPADPAAAIAAELSGPLGLSAIELGRLVPDRAPGTCLSCRLPLSPRDGTKKCAWCLALHNLTYRPPAPEEALAAWSCKCGCPTHRAHQRHLGVRPALPRPGAMAVLRPLIAGGACYWASWHWPEPFSVIAALLCVVLFVTFVSRVIRRAVR